MEKLSELKTFVSHLETLRAPRHGMWTQLAEWLAPHRGVFEGEDVAARSTRRNEKAFTNIPSYALLRGAGGLTSGMTPRNAAWFSPDFADQELAEASGALPWLDDVDRVMKTTLADGGFYQAIHSFNTDLLWAGCAMLYVETDADTLARFECCHIGTFCVGRDMAGKLDAVARSIPMSPVRMADIFGKGKMTEGAREALDRDPYTPRRVIHVVRRRNMRDPRRKDRNNMPWESFFYEADSAEEILSEGGYEEMPYFFTVWNEGSGIYGTGPGDDALSDARMLHYMETQKIQGLGKLVDPPVQSPAMFKGKLDLRAGGVNYVLDRGRIEPIQDLSPYAQAIQHLQNEIQLVAQRVEQELIASLFASVPLSERPSDMSATEFLERKREALQQLGPVVAAYEPNVLTPVLFRVLGIIDRAGRLPMIPEALQGVPVAMKLEFISPIDNALRQTGAEASRALVQEVMTMAQVDPSVLDKVDLDQAVDEFATGIGAPGKVIRSDEDVAKIREQRAQQQQQQQQMMEMQQGADIAGSLAGAVADVSGAGTDAARAQMEAEQMRMEAEQMAAEQAAPPDTQADAMEALMGGIG